MNLFWKGKHNIEMASAEGTDSIELESVFSSKNRDIHSSTLKSTSGTEDGKQIVYTHKHTYNNKKKTPSICKSSSRKTRTNQQKG